jgi:glycosyltransferase involved in cell wall biosynthesis
VKRYGIYLAYAPTVDLRGEGLGRHLAALLRAAAQRPEMRFVVSCPSWTRHSLQQLCESEHIPADSFDILSPPQKPALLRIYEQWERRRAPRKRRVAAWWSAYMAWVSRIALRRVSPWRRRLIGSRSVTPLVVVGIIVMTAATIVAPFLFAFNALRHLSGLLFARLRKIAIGAYLAVASKTTERAARELIAGQAPKDVPTVLALYRQMQDVEIEEMHRLIEACPDIEAWYCPTAFWPSVTRLQAPQLICIPDVVLTDFATNFSELGGDRLLETFRQIEQVLSRGRHFVTYSDYVKRQTLVRRFGVDPSAVDVVNHGVNRVDSLVTIHNVENCEVATDALCAELVARAVRRSGLTFPAALGESTRFLFYASQFRPHKNLLNLLRACDYLLRGRYIGCKLVLTGNPEVVPDLKGFVQAQGLAEEVVFLHRLSPQELAACYRRAALSVNPSLFEGGLPFTFAESVSVGTPVVMARIPVTVEAIHDAELLRDMLFDPNDYIDIAARLEWALENRDSLYHRQRAYFDRAIAPRTWDDALVDYVSILDRIRASHAE